MNDIATHQPPASDATPIRLLALPGSLRRESLNRMLCAAANTLTPTGVVLDIFDDLASIPLFNEDAEAANGHGPPGVQHLRNAAAQADGLLIATPEYNQSIPGVLKNAIDQASRPWGKSVWAGKPTAVLGVSVGAIGTALAQQHLRNVLVFVNLAVMAQPEAFLQYKEGLIEADGTVTNEGTRKFLQGFVDSFLAWIAVHHNA